MSNFIGKSNQEVTINNTTDLCLYLLEDAHVSTVTGQAFGIPQCIRISYAASDDKLREALERIKKALNKLK
jgi:aspartate aminotransferase